MYYHLDEEEELPFNLPVNNFLSTQLVLRERKYYDELYIPQDDIRDSDQMDDIYMFEEETIKKEILYND